MNNFLIGHYNVFDEAKQNRDYKPQFWGVEACLLKSDEEIVKLKHYRDLMDFNIGIHFPLRANQWRLRDPQYMSLDQEVKTQSYSYLESEIEYAAKLNPKYILVHYPKPVILDDRVDWFGWKWRFSDSTEYHMNSEIDLEYFINESNLFFEWFSRKSVTHGFEALIELDAIPPFLHDGKILSELLSQHPQIKVCADIGRLHLQHMIDKHFDSFAFLESILEYVSEIHLWNIQVTDQVENSHYPALPELNTEEGWADIEKYFKILKSSNKSFRVLFEHQSNLISNESLDTCYQWISELCK